MRRRVQLFFGLLALLLAQWACQPGLIDWQRLLSGTATPVAPVAPAAQPLPQVPVTFTVQVPADTPQDGSTVTLTLLDEVTGLGLNPRRVPMQPIGGQLYRVQVELSQGSVVKYRYERLLPGGAIVEFCTDGLPVRYRLLRVDGAMEVSDQVARWNDTVYAGPVGRIQGQVTDPEGHPIPDVLLTAAGRHTLTTAQGTFLLDGLPPGTHNLVAYHLDQRYTIYQQLATVAPDAATPAQIRLEPRPLVRVNFAVKIPETQPRNPPVRLVGNLYSLGNTFGDLAGGLSTLAARAPVMQMVGDLQYALTLQLPAGAYVRYKYTLGDGYWNAERDQEGHFVLRELIVPTEGGQVQDVVQTWHSPHAAPVWLEMTPPADTPPDDQITLQLNPAVWTAPLPMWPLGDGRWGYLFYGPIGDAQQIGYRYCRNAACAAAAEADQYGAGAFGRPLTSSPIPQTLRDEVHAWAWYSPAQEKTVVLAAEPQEHQAGFVTGVALAPMYSPVWPAYMQAGLQEIRHHLHARWLFLTPTWSATRINLPVFEPVPGYDPLWQDVVTLNALARQADLQVAFYPMLRFPTTEDEWWAQAARDFGWWNAWFDRYRDFALNFADAAAATGTQILVLGGEWVAPALPGGLLPNGQAAGVPADADLRWRKLIAEVREHYSGAIYWALPFPLEPLSPPPFLEKVDGILLEWHPALSADPNAQEPELAQATASLLDEVVHPLFQSWGKPVILAPAYPAADGGITGCPRYANGCLMPQSLRPGMGPADLLPDLQEQVDAYNALLISVNARSWLGGVVVREFDPLVALQDPSPSLYGKPAADVVGYWFQAWESQTSP